MASEWFYQLMGREFGPVAWAELRRLAEIGALQADTPVHMGVAAPWVWAREVHDLFHPDLPAPTRPVVADRSRWLRLTPLKAALTAGGILGVLMIALLVALAHLGDGGKDPARSEQSAGKPRNAREISPGHYVAEVVFDAASGKAAASRELAYQIDRLASNYNSAECIFVTCWIDTTGIVDIWTGRSPAVEKVRMGCVILTPDGGGGAVSIKEVISHHGERPSSLYTVPQSWSEFTADQQLGRMEHLDLFPTRR